MQKSFSHFQGTVYYLCTSTSCIISYEGVAYASAAGTITVQTELFASGAIEIRYGNGTGLIGSTFAAGVQDTVQGINVPVALPGCGPTGLCIAGQAFPSNRGMRFACTFPYDTFFPNCTLSKVAC